MLKGLLFSELQQLMASIGEQPDRAQVLCGWLYHSGRLIKDVNDVAGGESRDGDSLQPHRMGWETRNNIRSCATADGGLVLEVCDQGEGRAAAVVGRRWGWGSVCSSGAFARVAVPGVISALFSIRDGSSQFFNVRSPRYSCEPNGVVIGR